MFILFILLFFVNGIHSIVNSKSCHAGFFLKSHLFCEDCLDYCSKLNSLIIEHREICIPFCSTVTSTTVAVVDNRSYLPYLALILIPVALVIFVIFAFIYRRRIRECCRESVNLVPVATNTAVQEIIPLNECNVENPVYPPVPVSSNVDEEAGLIHHNSDVENEEFSPYASVRSDDNDRIRGDTVILPSLYDYGNATVILPSIPNPDYRESSTASEEGEGTSKKEWTQENEVDLQAVISLYGMGEGPVQSSTDNAENPPPKAEGDQITESDESFELMQIPRD